MGASLNGGIPKWGLSLYWESGVKCHIGIVSGQMIPVKGINVVVVDDMNWPK